MGIFKSKVVDDPIGTLLNMGSVFNWIDPSIAIGQRLFRGGTPFRVDGRAGYAWWDIREMLSRYNVDSWGYDRTLDGDVISFCVSKKDVKRTAVILAYSRVPFW